MRAFLSIIAILSITIIFSGCTSGSMNYNPTPTLTPEQIKSAAFEITYDELLRNNELHINNLVKIEGDVIQVIENGPDDFVLLVDMSKLLESSKITYVTWHGKRMLEGDHVIVYGTVKGVKTYTTVQGASKTVPLMDAELISYYS